MQEQWIVFDNDATGSLITALATDARLGARAIARFSPELETALHETFHYEKHRCGGYTLHLSRAAAEVEAANPFYSDNYLNRPLAVPCRIDQQADVVPALELVDTEHIIGTIECLQDMGTRYYDSDAGQDAALELEARWSDYGIGRSDFSVTRFEHPWKQDSVIASIKGAALPGEIVVIGGHLDSINKCNQSVAPGADDNASGIAAVSEVLRVVLAYGFRPQRTLQFMAYAAEEVGLRGSCAIAEEYKRAAKNVVAALQLDMTGFSGSPHDMYFVNDYVSRPLTDFLKKLIGEYNRQGPHEITFGDTDCGYACSDHVAWTRVGVPAAFPFEALFSDYNKEIHTARDLLRKLDKTGTKQACFAKLGIEFMMEISTSRTAMER